MKRKDIVIAPVQDRHVTPCELLEDFADKTPGWSFLEDDTLHYAAEKGVAACVLRYFRASPFEAADLAFAAAASGEQEAVRLILYDSHPGSSDADDPSAPLQRFIDDFSSYIGDRHLNVALHVVERDVQAPERPASARGRTSTRSGDRARA